jgi:hypothetical protein
MQSAQSMQVVPHTHVVPLPQPPSSEQTGRHTGAFVFMYTQLWSAVVHGQDGPSSVQAANANRRKRHRMAPF